jgi:hypothetical protein
VTECPTPGSDEPWADAPGADSVRREIPPAAESVTGRIRRYWRSRGRYGRFRYWLVFRGLPLGILFAALYGTNGWVNGWVISYELTLAIRSPADPAVSAPALGWLLSLAGWLVAPGVAGAVAGYVISSAIEARRRARFDALFTEDDDE